MAKVEIKSQLKKEAEARNPSDQPSLRMMEKWLALEALEGCFTRHPPGDALECALKEIFTTRWETIRGSKACYTLNSHSSVNTLYCEIAALLSPIPDSMDEWAPGQGPYFLLMPTLKSSRDIFGTNIHDYALHEFIISDDATRFIPLVDCLAMAVDARDSTLKHIACPDGYSIQLGGKRKPKINDVPYHKIVLYLQDEKIFCAVRANGGNVAYFPYPNQEDPDIRRLIGKNKLLPKDETTIFNVLAAQGYAQENQSFPALSDSETSRIANHSTLARKYYELIVGLNQMRLGGDSLGAQLERLKNALLRGGERQTGSADNAAVAAIDGVVNFVNYWQALPLETQEGFYHKYLYLEGAIRRFIRPTVEDESQCVEITAQWIDILLTHYKNTIYADIADVNGLCSAKQCEFETVLQRADYRPAIAHISESALLTKGVLSSAFSSTLQDEPSFRSCMDSLLSHTPTRLLQESMLGDYTAEEQTYIAACSQYVLNITQAINKKPSDALAQEKREIVLNAMHALLTTRISDPQDKLIHFRAILTAGQKTLSTRRDSAFETFVKALGVLGAGIFLIVGSYFAYQGLFGKTATEGKKLLHAVNVRPADEQVIDEDAVPKDENGDPNTPTIAQ